MIKQQTHGCRNSLYSDTQPDEDVKWVRRAKSMPLPWDSVEEQLTDRPPSQRVNQRWVRAAQKVRVVVLLGLFCRDINCYGASTFARYENSVYQRNTEHQLQRIREAKASGREVEVKKPWYILDPQSSFRKLWNALTVLLLLYTALIMPFRLAFSEDDSSQSWFIIERVIDGLFFLDVLLTCFTANELDNGELDVNLCRIVLRYLRSWMVFDVVACIPFSMLETEDQGTVSSSSYKSLARFMRLPRLYRLIRISKLYRMVVKGKFVEIMERLQDCLAMNRGATKVLKFALTVMVCVHIVACLWYYLSKLQNFGPDSWVGRTQVAYQSEGSRYIACMYWAVATLTTVGYGDVVGSTDLERIFSICWMIFGVVLYGFTIGSLTSILLRINSKNFELLVKLNAADQMVQESQLSEEIKWQMHRALRFRSKRAELESKDKKLMFDSLPKKLRYEVACAMYGGVVEKISFFQKRSPEWVSSVIPFLQYSYFDGGEYVYHINDDSSELYVLLAGRVDFILGNETIVFKRMLEGSYFGDIEMVQRKKRLCSCAMECDGELLIMSRATLKLIETDFPEVYAEMETLANNRYARLIALKSEVELAVEAFERQESLTRRQRTSGTERASGDCKLPLLAV